LALVMTLCGAALLILPAAEPPGKPPANKKPQPQTPEIAMLKITGPHAHENLSIFLIHGKDRVKGKKFLTLAEALKQKKIVVHETGNVGELTVENTGQDTIYIQPGEIVKGGKQDRMLPYAAIIPPKSGKKPISSFCVESGRWSRRGRGPVTQFYAVGAVAASPVALAGKLEADQGKVWREVARKQAKLSASVGESVQAAMSPSSLQLSLENKKLQAAAEPYRKKLAKLPAGAKDAIGFAVAINGKVSGAETFASHALLVKLWPKLLQTGAFEAIAERKTGAKFAKPTVKDVREFLAEAPKALARERKIGKDLKMLIRESSGSAYFRTVGAGGDVIHESWNAKEKEKEKEKDKK